MDEVHKGAETAKGPAKPSFVTEVPVLLSIFPLGLKWPQKPLLPLCPAGAQVNGEAASPELRLCPFPDLMAELSSHPHL